MLPMSQILQPLLANFATISIMVSLWSYLADHLERQPRWARDLTFGLLCGFSGVLVIQLAFEAVPGFRFDLRCVPIVLAGFFGGPIGGSIAAGMTAASRYAAGGAGMSIGVVTLIPPLLVGLANYYVAPARRDAPLRALILALTTSATAVSILLLLPAPVREVAIREGIPQLSLGMTFVGVLLPAAALLYDRSRKEAAMVNRRNTAVIQSLPDCLNVKDWEGRFLMANEATARLMGARTAVNLVGKTDFDFYPHEAAKAFLADEALVMRQRKPITIEQTFTRDDGQQVWLSTLKAPFQNDRGDVIGLITHNRDITEQRHLEAELALTQRRLRDALAHMQDGLLMFDREGRLVLSNPGYGQLFPRTGPLLKPGMSIADLLEAAVSTGEVSLPEGVEPSDWIARELSQPAPRDEFEITGGRWIERRTSPTQDGGWVSLFSDITARKQSERDLATQAHTDGLTGLLNRRTFDERFYAEFARTYRTGRPLGMVMIDVDHFKAFNDMYGHPAGDACLQQVAAALTDHCRPNDTLARYGGEEFVALFPETDEERMEEIAHRLVRSVRGLEMPHSGSTKGIVTISAGWAVTGMDDRFEKPAEFLRLCDGALYHAKGAGRDCARSAPKAAQTPQVQVGIA